MSWSVEIAFADPDRETIVERIPTPHLHIAIESALWKAGISGEKTGSFQITATSVDRLTP